MCYVRNEEVEWCKMKETIKSLGNEKGHTYLGMLQFDSVKSKETKDMITKKY